MHHANQRVRLCVGIHEPAPRLDSHWRIEIGPRAPIRMHTLHRTMHQIAANDGAGSIRFKADRKMIRRMTRCRFKPDFVVERIVAGD